MARYTGGCLCGALRYEATGNPTVCGYCCCGDCRKASGSGFIPFMGFARSAVRFTGQVLAHRSRAASGGDAVRNSCVVCGSLVFGGELDHSDSFTIYAGSLDEPLGFQPTIAIFTRDLPAWVVLPAGLTVFEDLPIRSADRSDR
ncbi:MAG: GFA family protein [Gammaproteobacteria bacterium]